MSSAIKASRLAPSSLLELQSDVLCRDYLEGFCRRAEECSWSHEICAIPNVEPQAPTLQYPDNLLSMDPRGLPRSRHPLDDDGPGILSFGGPRHDNDHVEIQHIKILPTINEILSTRSPYVPKKGAFSSHRLPFGQKRLLDIHFRQLRYESTECIIDSCYHASQCLVKLVKEPRSADYDYRMVTPKGVRYSLFRDVRIEELIFNEKKSITVRLSFACPKALRGRGLGPSKNFEDGMLVALVGLDQDGSLSTTFLEIEMRQTTEAMRPRTGNDLKASVILSFADPSDTNAVRRVLYNAQGLLQENFILVDIPKVLYAGFYWTLQHLQHQYEGNDRLAFCDTVAPSAPDTTPTVSLPRYSTVQPFVFRLDSLRKKGSPNPNGSLDLKPVDFISSKSFQTDFIDRLCQETTLDRGQACALCESLCRDFAFTQGPPGTGKTFLEGIRDAGIGKLARVGRGSKENWTQAYNISNLRRSMKKTSFERGGLKETYTRADGLEKVDESAISDIRLARKAGGFAYEYWCTGGDLKDVDRLLEKFNTMLGNDFKDEADFNLQTRQRVMDQIFCNASHHLDPVPSADDNVWHLDLNNRKSLLQKWKEEIDVQTIVDKTVEVHRRHQVAITKNSKVHRDIDARCLGHQDICAMTTTAAAKLWSTLKKVNFQTVICEEAGEVMEAQFLCTLLPTVEHSISIGDPLQLRPQVNESILSLETDAGVSYRLDESLMERFMLPATPGIEPIPSSRLNIQRRMHPDIAELMRATLYPYLEDHPTTFDRDPVPVMVDRIWWLDHQMPEDVNDPRSPAGTSSSNAFEVEMTAGLVEHLVKSNEYDFRDITILTGYNSQLAALTERFSSVCSLWLSEKDRETLSEEGLLDPQMAPLRSPTNVQISSMLRLATIDNFQGEESRVIILNTVRSNLDGQIGFLRTINRINVGCSRARNGFYVIGNASLMRRVEMWQQIIDNFTINGKIGPAFRTCCPRHPHPDRSQLVDSPEQWQSLPECDIHSTNALAATNHVQGSMKPADMSVPRPAVSHAGTVLFPFRQLSYPVVITPSRPALRFKSKIALCATPYLSEYCFLAGILGTVAAPLHKILSYVRKSVDTFCTVVINAKETVMTARGITNI
ncbi:hypothetical protein ACLMJK_003026 [Lecanora helva]